MGGGHGLVGAHRRDLRAPGVRRRRAPLDAGGRARAGRPLHRGQRRGQDVCHDRMAGRVDDRPHRRDRPPPPTSSRTRPPMWPTSSQRAALAAVSGDLSAVAEMRAAFDRRRLTIHGMLNEIDGRELHHARRGLLRLPLGGGLLGREIRRPPADVERRAGRAGHRRGQGGGGAGRGLRGPGLLPDVLRPGRRRPGRGGHPSGQAVQRRLAEHGVASADASAPIPSNERNPMGRVLVTESWPRPASN